MQEKNLTTNCNKTILEGQQARQYSTDNCNCEGHAGQTAAAERNEQQIQERH